MLATNYGHRSVAGAAGDFGVLGYWERPKTRQKRDNATHKRRARAGAKEEGTRTCALL